MLQMMGHAILRGGTRSLTAEMVLPADVAYDVTECSSSASSSGANTVGSTGRNIVTVVLLFATVSLSPSTGKAIGELEEAVATIPGLVSMCCAPECSDSGRAILS